jgi:hypothetical protein
VEEAEDVELVGEEEDLLEGAVEEDLGLGEDSVAVVVGEVEVAGKLDSWTVMCVSGL